MTDGELDRLEGEVEQARSRLVGDLERLRSPEAFAQARREITAQFTEKKDELVANAAGAARGRAQGMLSGVQARIAANPGAALAIGAGLAWRFYRHPPIASLLVGAGVMALMRTDPQHPAMGADAAARAADYAGAAQRKIRDWREADPAGQVSERVAAARDRVAGMADTVRERVEDYADTARERIGEITSDAGGTAMGAIRRAAITGDRWTRPGQRAISGAVADMGDRDKVLLGVAALALAAAVGVAARRRED